VIDLSSTGIRILGERAHQGVVSIQIRTFDDALTLTVEIVWSRKLAHRQFLIGGRLVGVSADDQRTLARLASSHRNCDLG